MNQPHSLAFALLLGLLPAAGCRDNAAAAPALANPAVHSAIVGARNSGQIEQSALAADVTLGADDLTRIENIMSGSLAMSGPSPETSGAGGQVVFLVSWGRIRLDKSCRDSTSDERGVETLATLALPPGLSGRVVEFGIAKADRNRNRGESPRALRSANRRTKTLPSPFMDGEQLLDVF